MAIDYETIDHTIDNYVADVKTAMPVDRVFLYGSHAKGNANKYSDIDLCFFLNSFENQDSIEIVKTLFRMTRKYKGMDIQPIAFTISDLKTDNPFVKEILRTGREL